MGATHDLQITSIVASGFCFLQAVKNGSAITASPTQLGQKTPILNLISLPTLFRLHPQDEQMLVHPLYKDILFGLLTVPIPNRMDIPNHGKQGQVNHQGYRNES